jgi:hypothetical protein
VVRTSEGAWFRSEKNTRYATVAGKMASLGVRGSEHRVAAWAAAQKVNDTTRAMSIC